MYSIRLLKYILRSYTVNIINITFRSAVEMNVIIAILSEPNLIHLIIPININI